MDRATAAVFADGAGAVVLERTDGAGRIGPVVLGADGAGAEHIYAGRDDGVIHMRGHETFREAVARLTLATLQATRAAGVALDDIDLFVYHQANGRILSAVGERLGLRPGRVVDCIGEYGNTSAATLPLALGLQRARGTAHPGCPRPARRLRRRLHVGRDRTRMGASVSVAPRPPQLDARVGPLERLECSAIPGRCS